MQTLLSRKHSPLLARTSMRASRLWVSEASLVWSFSSLKTFWSPYSLNIDKTLAKPPKNSVRGKLSKLTLREFVGFTLMFTDHDAERPGGRPRGSKTKVFLPIGGDNPSARRVFLCCPTVTRRTAYTKCSRSWRGWRNGSQ